MKETKVRCSDRTVFEVNPVTLDAIGSRMYDAYCYVDPEHDVEYIEYGDWVSRRNKMWDLQRYDYYRKQARNG